MPVVYSPFTIESFLGPTYTDHTWSSVCCDQSQLALQNVESRWILFVKPQSINNAPPIIIQHVKNKVLSSGVPAHTVSIQHTVTQPDYYNNEVFFIDKQLH
jgi:hypothetical protein